MTTGSRCRPIPIALLFIAALGPPARGGSVVLPALHGPAPAHVPTLSDPALVRLWARDQSSPILRDPGIEVQLCRAVAGERDRDPARFDRNHPVLGHLLRDPGYLDAVLRAYVAHPARFTHYHHRLVPFLRGCALAMPLRAPTPSIVAPGPIVGAPGPLPVTPMPGAEMASVPAPPGLVLLGIGLGCAAVGLLKREG